MDNVIIRKTFRYAGMAGLLLIITNAFLFLILPMKSGPMPDGFRMPLVAFEFLKTESETEIMFYDSGTEERGKLINAMDTANKVDFFFMACYTTFLVLYAAALFMESRNKIYYAGIFLALLVCVADLMENLQMLSITSKLGYGGYSHELWRLNQYTWMKWGCLSVNMLLLSWQQFRNSGFYFSLSAIATAASLTGVIAFIHRGIFNEIFLGLLAVCFALMIASCFFKRPAPPILP